MEEFSIPITLFFFKRDKIVRIIERISEIRPKKLYLSSDGPRNDEEKILVNNCRKLVEESIKWDCEIIKNYAENNKGVYDRIGLGAKWVLSQEQYSIFLEDDNLPELSFFKFCEELLERYKNDTRILWICGTNYLEKYKPVDGSSYVFTKHMLPCGWASWSHKFNIFYDGNLNLCKDEYLVKRIEMEYCNKAVYRQYKESWISEYEKLVNKEQPISWDYQMDFSIKVNGLYGICPKNNLIENIGVDESSIHGGKSFSNIMTKRFCSMKTIPIRFPLVHPKTVLTDLNFEKRIGKVLLYPKSWRIKTIIVKILKILFNVRSNKSFTTELKNRVTIYKKT